MSSVPPSGKDPLSVQIQFPSKKDIICYLEKTHDPQESISEIDKRIYNSIAEALATEHVRKKDVLSKVAFAVCRVNPEPPLVDRKAASGVDPREVTLKFFQIPPPKSTYTLKDLEIAEEKKKGCCILQ